MAKVTEWSADGPPEVTFPAIDHAALVVVDTYWVYISDCRFIGPPHVSPEKFDANIVALRKYLGRSSERWWTG